MTTAEVLARLTAHWPALGGNDQAAELRLADWARLVGSVAPETRAAACESLIAGWQGDWPPHLSDWQAACRQAAARLALDGGRPVLAIEGPFADREKVAAVIGEMRATLRAAKCRPVRRN